MRIVEDGRSSATGAQTDAQEAMRDQFMAFAFAASDLLIEIDAAGTITFVGGASERIGSGAVQGVAGMPLLELLEPSDRSLAAEHIGRLTDGALVTPLLVRLRRGAARAMMFGGCQLPQGRAILFLALGDHTIPPVQPRRVGGEAARDVLSRPVFTALVMRRIADDAAGALRLSFLEIGGFPVLAGRVAPPVLRGLSAMIGRQIRNAGSGVEAVGDLGLARYGVLHIGELPSADLAHAVRSLVFAAAPDGPELSLVETGMEPGRAGLHGRQAARVVRYAIERFAPTSEVTPTLAARPASLEDFLGDTVSRVTTLEGAIRTGAFDLAYQPVVDLGDRGLRHAEALVRFPDHASPLATVAAAEAADMIAEFDLAVCARAIDHIERGVTRFPAVAVNLSGRSLESRGFADRLWTLLKAHRALASRLLFELTETTILGEVESLNRIVQRLRRKGYRFCLDDLGSGANSFHYLRSIPMDFVKIDGAFGRDALKNERDRSFLRYVAGFCRENGIIAIAEMIETESAATSYRELGIDYGQGYLFGRPEIPR